MTESQRYEHQPFKAMPNPLLNKMMKANLEGFHPFTPGIMKTQLPRKWKWPSMEKYGGTSNSKAHVKAYITQANLLSENMVVHCGLFSTTLLGIALE